MMEARREDMARHVLEGFDPVAKTAHCAVCGPTVVYVRPSSGKRECKTKILLNHERDKAERPQKRAAHRRKYLYGITQSDFDRLYAEQVGKCGICLSNDVELVVDHCHLSNEVRGLLCRQCNFGLGHFRDSIESLLSAVKYLSR